MRLITTRAAGLLLAAASAALAAMAFAETPALEGTAWLLSELPGRTLRGDPPATLRFEGGWAQGFDGCNRYSVRYTATGPAIELSTPGVSTQMACPPEVMDQATAYMAALQGARSYRVADSQLQVLDGDGRPLATFRPQSFELAGTAWRATGINNGKGAVASLVAGSTVTLAFGDDGRASGSAGCNNFTTRYEYAAPRLEFDQGATTRKMCAGEDLMAQEQAFLEALQTVATARIEGHRLELRRTDGALAASFLRDDRK